MARYQCNLSPALLEKAATELNEPRDNALRLKAIDHLRNSFNTAKYGKLLQNDDSFLLRFLRARKFQHEKALKLLHKYHSIRAKFPEVFEKYSNPKALTAVLESGILYVVEGRTSEGEAIVIYRPDKHTAHINIFDVFACGQIAIDQLLESEEVQICGIVTIDDFQHFDPDSIKHVTLTEHGKVTKLLQDATPIRRKPVHVLNESGKFDVIYALMKPFMKRKFSSQIKLHGKSRENILGVTDAHLLPPCMGGCGIDPEIAAKKWKSTLKCGTGWNMCE